MARAKNGFGTKGLFFEVLRAHFQANELRVAKAFLGSACEQWLNGEAFQALLDNASVFAVPEYAKRDLVIFADPEAAERGEPEIVIESKLLYASESEATQETKLARLRDQLERAAKSYPTAQTVGLLVAFDWSWRHEDRGPEWRRPRANASLRHVSPRDGALGLRNKFGHRNSYRVCDGTEVKSGPYRYRVTATLELLELDR